MALGKDGTCSWVVQFDLGITGVVSLLISQNIAILHLLICFGHSNHLILIAHHFLLHCNSVGVCLPLHVLRLLFHLMLCDLVVQYVFVSRPHLSHSCSLLIHHLLSNSSSSLVFHALHLKILVALLLHRQSIVVQMLIVDS